MLKNKLAVHKTTKEKLTSYQKSVANNELAYKSDGTSVPLATCRPGDVEFIGGLWRVQNNFPYKIQEVRGTEFVLHERMPNKEKNLFEFFRASQVCCNCYGYFMVPASNRIVAKYTTDNQTYWSYGNSIEQARAFLGIRLYDEHMDLIHSVACKDCVQRVKK